MIDASGRRSPCTVATDSSSLVRKLWPSPARRRPEWVFGLRHESLLTDAPCLSPGRRIATLSLSLSLSLCSSFLSCFSVRSMLSGAGSEFRRSGSQYTLVPQSGSPGWDLPTQGRLVFRRAWAASCLSLVSRPSC